MALFIVDGVPGAGKTLNTIKEVRDRATKEGRPVYYNYISELSPDLGWLELSDDQIRDWHNQLPEGAILVIDEAWRHFPKWETKKQPPDYVLAFFQHRKKGHDVYLIVQSARVQIDPVVYENTEAHVHFQRVAGSTMVKRFEWNGTVGNPKSASSISSARISFKRLDPEIFKLYKSAEIHTHKFRPPWKFLAAIALCLFAIGLTVYNGIGAAAVLSGNDPEPVATIDQLPPDISQGNMVASSFPGQTGENMPLTPEAYAPRVAGLPWTAPVYDHLRKPKSFPRPAGCLLNIKTDACHCYTQQATPLPVDDTFCRLYVANGTFDDQIPDRPLSVATAGTK